MRAAHRVLASLDYAPGRVRRGYADRTLHVDLSANRIEIRPVTQYMKDFFTGGKGFDLYLMWQSIPGPIAWDDPRNGLYFSAGPLGGTPYFSGSGKCLVTGISPTHRLGDGLQRRRALRAAAQVRRLRRPRGARQGRPSGRCSSSTATRTGSRIETAPHEALDSYDVAEPAAPHVRAHAAPTCRTSRSSRRGAGRCTRSSAASTSRSTTGSAASRASSRPAAAGSARVMMDKKLKAIVAQVRAEPPALAHVGPRRPEREVAPMPSVTVPDVLEVDAIVDRWGADPEFAIEMLQDVQERFRHLPEGGARARSPSAPGPTWGGSTTSPPSSRPSRSSRAARPPSRSAPAPPATCRARRACSTPSSASWACRPGETTPDLKYSLEGVRCLGCCGLAPVVTFGAELLGGVDSLQGRQADAPAPQDRLGHAPQAPARRRRTPMPRLTLAEPRRASREQAAAAPRRLQGHAHGLHRHRLRRRPSAAAARRASARSCERRGLAGRDSWSWPPAATASAPTGPICVVQPEGVFYQQLKAEAVPELDRVALRRSGSRSSEFLLPRGPASERGRRSRRTSSSSPSSSCIALRNRGSIDPEDIDRRTSPRRLPGAAQGPAARTPRATVIRRGDRARACAAAAAAASRPASSGSRCLKAAPRARRGAATSSATATRATPAPSWTAASSRPTRTR